VPHGQKSHPDPDWLNPTSNNPKPIELDPLTALIIIAFAIVAGLIGSLLGLGGGVVIIPALTLALGFNMQEAVGASLIGVIASSTGSASRYVQQGFVNIKLGMLLETTTTVGSVIGAIIAIYTDQQILALIFAIMLTYSAVYMLRRPERTISPDAAELDGQMLDLSCTYTDRQSGKDVCYGVKGIKTGLGAGLLAGATSGMLGVGGGVIKVPVMNACMCVPIKAATATSNFMIGVTALAGAVVYYSYGLISPVLAATVAVGVIIGAFVGTHLTFSSDGHRIRTFFSLFLLAIAVLMVLKAVGLLEAV
jgi:uncharacterized protein